MPRPAPPTEGELRTFRGLRRVVATLRGPKGCPWDRVQTHETLRPYLSEETAEVLAAINSGDPTLLKEELGDLLFEVLIHVQLAEEAGSFTMAEVIEGIASKLVRRHPHVFAGGTAETPEQVVAQWDELKAAERIAESVLDGIPETLPSLAYAQAIQQRAARAGFKWENERQVWAAFEEEVREAHEAASAEERRVELGDALFALVNLCQHFETDAEDALRTASERFGERFRRMEAAARDRGANMKRMSLGDKLTLWEETRASTVGGSP